MKITHRSKISASTGPKYQVFMLVDDREPTCMCKFFAKDIIDAEKQLADAQTKYSLPNSLRVIEFDPSFDNFNDSNLLDYQSNEVFNNLDAVFRLSNQWVDDYPDDLPFASTSLKHSGRQSKINTATYNYGGAYDVEDDMFFTREEIVEWADSVADELASRTGASVMLNDVYFTDTTMLTIELSVDDSIISTTVNVDMRRIRNPRDIDKYIPQVVDALEADYRSLYNDNIEMSTDITADIRINEGQGYYDPEDNFPTVQDTIKISLYDVVVEVDDEAYTSFEDATWADDVELESTTYPGLELDDVAGMMDKVDTMLVSAIPAASGRYIVNGTVTLAYDISGVRMSTSGDYPYTGDAEIEWNWRDSTTQSIEVTEA